MNSAAPAAAAEDAKVYAEKMFYFGILHKAIAEMNYAFDAELTEKLLDFLHKEYVEHYVKHAVLRAEVENPQIFRSPR